MMHIVLKLLNFRKNVIDSYNHNRLKTLKFLILICIYFLEVRLFYEETKDVASNNANKEDEKDQEVNGDQDKVENYY